MEKFSFENMENKPLKSAQEIALEKVGFKKSDELKTAKEIAMEKADKLLKENTETKKEFKDGSKENKGQEEETKIEKEKTIEKSAEEILADKRREFAKKELELEKQKLAGKRIDDPELAQELALIENDYREALKNYRKELLEKAKLLPEKEREKRIKEILIETTAKEANHLYDLKTDLKLQERSGSKIEKIKNVVKNAVDKYRKMPLRYKLLISAGLLSGGIAAGAIGGATGAALAAGVITGRWFQRVFGGAATAVGLEALIKRSQEKKEEKQVVKEFEKSILDVLEKNNTQLDNKIFELEKSKKAKAIRRYVLAGTAGVLVGSGLVGKAIRNVFNIIDVHQVETAHSASNKSGVWQDFKKDYESMTPADQYKTQLMGALYEKTGRMPTKEELETIFSGQKTGAITADELNKIIEKMKAGVITKEEIEKIGGFKLTQEVIPKAGLTNIVEVQKGDSIWKIAAKQLEQRFGDKFNSLNEAQKTYVIDAIKDKVAAHPEKFGLTDIDQLKVGQKIDFSSIFEKNEELQKIFEKAGNLTPQQTENILHHNQEILNWLKAHPHEALTGEKVEQILHQKPSGVLEPQIDEQISQEPQIDEQFPQEPQIDEQISQEPQIDEQHLKEPAPQVETSKATGFEDIKNWLEKYQKIDVEKSSFLSENFLKTHKVSDVLSPDFIGDRDYITGAKITPEVGSLEDWEINERTKLQELVKGILKEIDASDKKLGTKLGIEWRNKSLYELFKTRIDYLKELSKIAKGIKR